ncbi:MAG: translation elongation factor Ts [Opitutales bacterium]|nr:translation elongation factor Ts [Opitutales bacterium]
MSNITKEAVMDLREKTGAGLIDCKRALSETNGDLDEAISILRKKGVASAAKKAGREAGEGIISNAVSADRKKGILVEVNCETDFVAKNEDFIKFSKEVAETLLTEPNTDLENKRTEQVGKIGENIKISRSEIVEIESNGIVESYVHTGAKVAVMISIISSDQEDLSSNEYLITLAKDLCMHIAATSPVCISRDDIAEELVSKEKDIAMAQAEGKPPQAIEKIVSGKLEKYFAASCLVEQPFVKDPDSSVKDLLAKTSAEVGSDLSVGTFLRFQVGENN